MDTTQFWEDRARQFARDGEGLRAVCSYAMPWFYNRAIDVTQRAALRGILATIGRDSSVLDYGCGVGRWTREIARRGARVTAVDISATMLAEARRRADAAGLGERCSFVRADVTSFAPTERYDLIFGVTVLQHVLDDRRLTDTIARFARYLKPGGRLIMVEAAPSLDDRRCDSVTFRARPLDGYLRRIEAAGLRVQDVRGLDPAPFKLWVIPRFKRWPKPVALGALGLATAAALPIDLLFGRWSARRSWHKIIVASAAGGLA